MRIAPSAQPILFGILVHLLVAGVASSRIGIMNYQHSNPGNCRPEQAPTQNIPCCQSDFDGDGMSMPMSRPSNAKQVGANIALQAAHDAKKASDTQMPAAVAAARQVKLQLADRAGAAAWAAEAALSGKQQVVEQLKSEVHEAETVFQDESASVGVAQNNLNAAACTANQANDLLQKLQSSVRTAQETVSAADVALCGAHQELQEKNKLVEAAQHRVEMLVQQLRNAKQDYENTKKAAYKASCAAAEARQKAMRERRASAKQVNAYRDQQQKYCQAQAQAQAEAQAEAQRQEDVGQKHHQTPLGQEPLQNLNSNQKQPEEWEYSQQVNAKCAGGAKQPKTWNKRRFSGKNTMRTYREEPQQKEQQQAEIRAELQEAEQKHEENVSQNQPEQWEYNEQGKVMFSS